MSAGVLYPPELVPVVSAVPLVLNVGVAGPSIPSPLVSVPPASATSLQPSLSLSKSK